MNIVMNAVVALIVPLIVVFSPGGVYGQTSSTHLSKVSTIGVNMVFSSGLYGCISSENALKTEAELAFRSAGIPVGDYDYSHRFTVQLEGGELRGGCAASVYRLSPGLNPQ